MPVASPWSSLAPYSTQPAWTFLAQAAERLPHQPALICPDGKMSTYRELWELSCRLARFLQRDAAVAPGETVAIVAPGSRETAAILHAAWLAGARVSFLNAFQKPAEFAYYLADAEAVVAFASGAATPTLQQARRLAPLPRLRHVFRSSDVWTLAEPEAAHVDPAPIDPARHDALLVYSSGTTGMPMGARQSHLSRIAAARQRLAVLPLDGDAVVLSVRPFWTDLTCCIAAGVPLVTCARPEPIAIRALLSQHRVTMLMARPTSVQALLDEAARASWGLSPLRLIESSGAPLPDLLMAGAAERFALTIVQSYQMTQAPAANFTPAGAQRPASVGPPVPDTEEMLVDPESGREVGPGEIGEVWLRGPQIMTGYWRQPAASAAALVAGGWLRTGDLGRLDADGYLYLVDRLKALMKVGDWPVYPAEIEAVLLQHPAVREAAVVPQPSATRGEAPHALVVLRGGQEVPPVELLAFVADRLAPYKVPESVQIVPALPHGPGGKLLRRALAQQIRSHPLASHTR